MKTAEQILQEKGYDHREANQILNEELDLEIRKLYKVDNHPIHLWESYAIGDSDEKALLKDAESNTTPVKKYDDVEYLFDDMTNDLNRLAEQYKPKPIEVDESELRGVLRESLESAKDFDWSGWRIPIYVLEDGTVTTGDWLSQGSYSPSTHEIYGIKSWSMDEVIDKEGNEVEDETELTKEEYESNLENHLDHLEDFHMERIFEKLQEDREIAEVMGDDRYRDIIIS
jgi:hypothetical protein